MEGFCETNNFSPKWQSLKFAEILVWRGVSDHFQHLDIVVIWYICLTEESAVHTFLRVRTSLHRKKAGA